MAPQPQPKSRPPSPLGSLATVPLEIRQMIYSLVLASSSSLIGTSSAIKTETWPILYKDRFQPIQITFDRLIFGGRSASYFDTCTFRKAFFVMNPPEWTPDQRSQAPVVNISITVDMVEPYIAHGGSCVCTPRLSFSLSQLLTDPFVSKGL